MKVQVTYCNHLEVLGVGVLDVTDVGLQHLVNLPKLRSVNLMGTRVTDDAVAAFQRACRPRKIEIRR